MPKRFTLREVQSLLPEVTKLMREAVALKSQYAEAEQSFQSLTQRIMMAGGLVVDRETALQDRTRRDRCGERLKATLESIQEIGGVVKDLDTGLVDFPTIFRGEEVYLCWKLGETEIQFWHGLHEGFAGRKPIDQDFLLHHEGDKTN